MQSKETKKSKAPVIINPRKIILSNILYWTGIEKLLFGYQRLRHGDYWLRVVNYHSTAAEFSENFELQLQYYQKYYSSVSMEELELFFGGKWNKSKPGLIISFDDGLYNNYTVAKNLLEKYGFVGWFFVSPGFCDAPANQQLQFAQENRITKATPLQDGRLSMNWDELRELSSKHVIGCHTKHHCRLYQKLGHETLMSEIIESKRILEDKLKSEIKSFCWVGGEPDTYNEEAMRLIVQGGYQFAFTSISLAVTALTNKYLLGRTNIESSWPLKIVRFQLSGAMDIFFLRKRWKVHGILKRGLKAIRGHV